MALQKAIEQPNGIVLNYHRVNSLDIITNRLNIINVDSYINATQRQREKDWYDNPTGDMNVLIVGSTFETTYDQNMTIDDAYEYLKTTGKFAGATDC